ncbi:hypothetical protein EKE94_06405 [Mesobaculum littorinae]|uniref:C-type lysozyme inhibitor domain-containing protein n=1 Tax=Mesobaculum littorinae TaxID=2486419 RepID=A0A438AIQ8_9RHOB|nr:MliC family protein [Mesobaculum littorinae]RVV98544.1 hypothetical protein EKE94_06405 [Mesobaculum littorinae]
MTRPRHSARLALCALSCIAPLTTTASLAATGDLALSLSLPQDDRTTVIPADYDCDQGPDLSVRYINAGANSLALIPVEGAELVFVQTLSASGARYVSGVWEWWSKGDGATLRNLTDDSARSCTARDAGVADD